VFFGLHRVHWTHGKATDSSSAFIFLKKVLEVENFFMQELASNK